MQGHIAISAHTVGTIVVIDESGSELRAFPTNHMPTGLAVVPAFGDGIEGLLAAHAHGDFLFPDRRRCPLPKIHVWRVRGSIFIIPVC